MIRWFGRKRDKPSPKPAIAINAHGIPTVKFDASRVTEAVKAEIRKCIDEIEGATDPRHDAIFVAALRSISAGRDLHALYATLMELGIDGMTKSKAAAIATHINNKATSLMNATQQQSLGIEYAKWLYSGAPCMKNPKKPTPEDIRRNAAHKAADGKRFRISEGMFLDGKWTWPGREEGCRCVSKSLVPGFR